MRKTTLKIEIPFFKVSFNKEVHYSATTGKGKEALKELLHGEAQGYCMYCYTRIMIDGKYTGHLEHAIEKNMSKDYLTECLPNIGVACSICNGKYKRYQEKKRMVSKDEIKKFESRISCEDGCREPCEAYLDLKKAYLRNESSHIILQPLGVIGEESGEQMALQYDVLETEFEPSNKYAYTIKEKDFIMDHIDRFHLNDKRSKTRQLISFLEDTIEMEGKYSKREYNNMVVKLFVEQILNGKNQKEILKICSAIYAYSMLKFRT